jgi:uroporphyrinogen decarboxylase
MRKPDFDNILKVLNREKPDRPTLFEFFMNRPLYERLGGVISNCYIEAFHRAGYDYCTFNAGFSFPKGERDHDRSVSLNEGVLITDRESFKKYAWPVVEDSDYDILARVAPEIPKGMKLIVHGPMGVLENIIGIVGYDNLCMMLYDDPELVQQIADNVGARLLRHYEIVGKYDTVGAMISNDDWGFRSQPMLSPDDMKKYIIPWHVKITEAIHSYGKPAILHSCGNQESLMDIIIDVCKYDGRHSYEDTIEPVEAAYERWGGRIAILGGIDLDFICRKTPEEIYQRSKTMLERAEKRGGYALGSGNSIPEYVPQEKYFAMISAAVGKIDLP